MWATFNIVWAATETPVCLHFFFVPLIFSWMALMLAMVLLWDPKPPYGSLTSGPPCVWSAPPSSPKRGGDITAVRAERWGISCTTFLLSRMRERWKGKKSKTYALFFHRLCANLAPPMNSLSNIKRTSLLECVTSVSKFFWSRKANRPINLEKELRLLSTKSRSWYPQPSKR